MNWITAGPEIFYFAAGLFFLLATFIGDGSRPRKAPPKAGRVGGLPNPGAAARRRASDGSFDRLGGNTGLPGFGGLGGPSFHQGVQGGYFLTGLQDADLFGAFSDYLHMRRHNRYQRRPSSRVLFPAVYLHTGADAAGKRRSFTLYLCVARGFQLLALHSGRAEEKPEFRAGSRNKIFPRGDLRLGGDAFRNGASIFHLRHNLPYRYGQGAAGDNQPAGRSNRFAVYPWAGFFSNWRYFLFTSGRPIPTRGLRTRSQLTSLRPPKSPASPLFCG